jgi:hypothetical protein
MKLYKSENNEVFAYEEDGSQDHLIGDKIAITQAEADAINAEKELARFNSFTYAEKRMREYPTIADQLDYIYHNGIDAWKTNMINPVKTKYPKGQ